MAEAHGTGWLGGVGDDAGFPPEAIAPAAAGIAFDHSFFGATATHGGSKEMERRERRRCKRNERKKN